MTSVDLTRISMYFLPGPPRLPKTFGLQDQHTTPKTYRRQENYIHTLPLLTQSLYYPSPELIPLWCCTPGRPERGTPNAILRRKPHKLCPSILICNTDPLLLLAIIVVVVCFYSS